jgi:hypothetical protein
MDTSFAWVKIKEPTRYGQVHGLVRGLISVISEGGGVNLKRSETFWKKMVENVY